MKRPPNYILLKQALRYLSEEEKVALISRLSKLDNANRPFFKCLIKYFDYEVFKTKPLIWQDIWLYNYIVYDTDKSLNRNGLIAKYEREVFIEDDAEFFKCREFLNSLKLKNKNAT